jgi:hypothetical protein
MHDPTDTESFLRETNLSCLTMLILDVLRR